MTSIEKESSFQSIKTIILGESHVGKTNIVNKLYGNDFETKHKPTSLSYNSMVKNYFKYSLEFHFWDTSGSQVYRSLNNTFMNNAEVAILVYDITSKSSFDEIKNYWLNQLVKFVDKDIGKIYEFNY